MSITSNRVSDSATVSILCVLRFPFLVDPKNKKMHFVVYMSLAPGRVANSVKLRLLDRLFMPCLFYQFALSVPETYFAIFTNIDQSRPHIDKQMRNAYLNGPLFQKVRMSSFRNNLLQKYISEVWGYENIYVCNEWYYIWCVCSILLTCILVFYRYQLNPYWLLPILYGLFPSVSSM